VIDGGEGAVLEQEAVADLVGIDVETHDMAAIVDAEGEGQRGTWDGDRGEVAVRVAQIPKARSHGIGIEAHDLAAGIDVQRVGRQGAGEIDGRVNALVQQKTPDSAGAGVEVDDSADDLAPVVEAQGLGRLAREVDRREAVFLEQVAVAAAAPVLVVPQDLPTVVDPQGRRSQGAWDVDGRVTPAVEEKTAEDEAGGVVPAHNLPAVVDAQGLGLEGVIRVLDRGELAPVEEETGPERVHGIVR
jgi:hypothetical protein